MNIQHRRVSIRSLIILLGGVACLSTSSSATSNTTLSFSGAIVNDTCAQQAGANEHALTLNCNGHSVKLAKQRSDSKPASSRYLEVVNRQQLGSNDYQITLVYR